MKCDGKGPICKTCKGYGDTNCIYDKPASVAYVRYLEKQTQLLLQELDSLKQKKTMMKVRRIVIMISKYQT